jgi:Domain of unknown function (DUF4386)
MTQWTEDRIRMSWARWIGFLLIATNLTAMFAVWVRMSMIAARDPAQTAANVAGAKTLFRVGLTFDLLTIAGVIPLVVGLYVVLKPVAPGLALLATAWRMIENAILAMLTFASFTALAFLTGGDFIRSLAPGAIHDLTYAMLRVHGAGFQVGFLFLGLGQILFSILWWKSRYVPRWLAGLGVFASAIIAAVAIAIIIWPPFYAIVTMAYMAPMGLYELGLGLWLLVRGVRLPTTA